LLNVEQIKVQKAGRPSNLPKWSYLFQESKQTGHWWLMPVILATWEAKIRRIVVGSQPGQIVHETLS
jgi:hypothetical protein